MNDSSGQFIAVCPNCSAILRVSTNKLGHNERCSQCHHTFVGGEALDSLAPQSAPTPEPPTSPIEEQVQRIDAVCPGCKATLHVRRSYVGNDVRCKYCETVFRMEDPGQVRPPAVREPEPDHAGPDSNELRAEHERLYVAHNLLEANHERLKTECDDLRHHFGRVTAELDAIRLALGSIAPEDVGALAAERQSLGEEVHRLRDEVHALVADRTERDRLVAERLHWDSELNLSRAERDILVNQLRDRDGELVGLRTENERLRAEAQAALEHRDAPVLSVFSDQPAPDLDRRQTAAGAASRAPEECATELEDLRAQVADVSLRLEHAEDLNREMAAMLRGMGIRYEPTWA